ncbi:hypothetical protein F7Q99_11975 [Streptomyces kaniharaensis]|uniref:Uncharacterized protein n=1 Tax=Streptomyces kaniharaensis TaxID=212423 RepID=A0A6N7KN83_9ACTN|nr:hypothetical protein [Streptomyces kaniharaensis]MQS12990.1 hypothetical protein [Streptomyces kaniharaensis]
MPAGAGTGRGARYASVVKPVLASAVAMLAVLTAQQLMRRRQVRRARAVLAEMRATRRRTVPTAPEAWSVRSTHW